MKKYIAMLMATVLSCNAMVQNISPQLAHEELTLLGNVRNNPITEQSFDDIKSLYAKIVKIDAHNAKSFIAMLTSTLADVDEAQYESLDLARRINKWIVLQLSKRTKSASVNEPQ